MHYTKPPLDFQQQAQRLLNQGLIAPDLDSLSKILSTINYYRLSAYWRPFKQIDKDSGIELFKPGTTIDMVLRRYNFDRHLRLLVMDAIERVEIAILHTLMVEHFTLLHGPFGYCDPINFSPGFDPAHYQRLMSEINDAVNRSREVFVVWFQNKYSDEVYLPLWMAVEVMTFGQIDTIFRNLHRPEQQYLSSKFDIFPPVLNSWLHTLNFVRNTCAHHARLWNPEIPIRPVLPDYRHHPEWYTPVSFDNTRLFTILTVLNYLLHYIDPQNDWQLHLEGLLSDYPDVPIKTMGFPGNWKECSLWKR